MFDPDFEYELEQIRHKSAQQQLAQQHREYRELCKADSWWDEQDKALGCMNGQAAASSVIGEPTGYSETTPKFNSLLAKWETWMDDLNWPNGRNR